MSDQGPGGESSTTDAIAKQARARQGRDKELVEAAREGDRNAFGKLYDSWVDHVYDRAVNGGASAAEAREVTEQTFLTVWHNLGRLKQPAAVGAKILQVAQRQAATRVRGAGSAPHPSGKPGEAEDRLTRTTDAANAAADPDVAAVLREASLALDDRTRAVLDLHYRQGLTPGEVGAVLGIDADSVKETIAKLPTALGVLTRARVLWRGGHPLDDELTTVLAAEQITAFDAATVRTINKFAKDHDRARARSMIAVAPIELYAAIPLAAAPAGLKMAVAELLVTEGVAMDGSAFVKRDDRGEILSKPKEKRADLNAPNAEAKARPAPPMAPSVDKKKAAAVAAAALAAEAVALSAEAEGATTLVAPVEDDRKSKVSERFRARKGAPAAAPAAAAGAPILDRPAPPSGPGTAGPAPADVSPSSLAPVDHGPVGNDGPGATSSASGTMPSDKSSSDNRTSDKGSSDKPLPPDASFPVGKGALGAAGLAALDPPPSAEDLEARAQGEAAAMGRAYTRPIRPEDGGDRVIPGAAHLDTDDGPNKKKALIIGGAVAAAVLLLGGAAFALKGSGDDTKTAANGPRPTNPAQAPGAGAATTTIPATTTTGVVETTLPAPTTTLAPDAGGDIPITPAPATGGGGAPSGGGAVTPATPAPVTANTAQAATGSFGYSIVVRNLRVNKIASPYSMVPPSPPTLSWDLTSTGGFTVRVSGPGLDGSVARGQSGSITVCPGTVVDDICTAPSGEASYTVTVYGFDGSEKPYRTVSFNVN